MERVSSTKFMDVHNTDDLSWTNKNAFMVKKDSRHRKLPLQIEESESPGADFVLLLLRQNWKHLDYLHHCVVQKIYFLEPQQRHLLQCTVNSAGKLTAVPLVFFMDHFVGSNLYCTCIIHILLTLNYSYFVCGLGETIFYSCVWLANMAELTCISYVLGYCRQRCDELITLFHWVIWKLEPMEDQLESSSDGGITVAVAPLNDVWNHTSLDQTDN